MKPPTAWSRLRLKHKLMVSYGALGALITVLSLLSGNYVNRRGERARLEQDLVMAATTRLASQVGSASEEGLSYVMSGDVAELAGFRAKLDAARDALTDLASARSLTGPERAALDEASVAVNRIDIGCLGDVPMEYPSTRRVAPGTYDGYEAAIDHAQETLAALVSAHRARRAEVESAAQATSRVMTLGIGLLAVALAIALGAFLGRRG